MGDEQLVERAIEEAQREGVELPYRLVMIRQHEHEASGRYKEASECAAIRHCLEMAYNKQRGWSDETKTAK